MNKLAVLFFIHFYNIRQQRAYERYSMLQYKICCSKSVCWQGGAGPTGFVPYTALKLEQAYLSLLCLVQLQITFWGVAPHPPPLPILQPHGGTYAIYCTHPRPTCTGLQGHSLSHCLAKEIQNRMLYIFKTRKKIIEGRASNSHFKIPLADKFKEAEIFSMTS
jgi:hypothetical protein